MPGQEANGDNLGVSFRSSVKYWYVECTNLNCLSEAVLIISTHNIQFHDKIRKFLKTFVFLSYQKNFLGTQKQS